MKTKQVNGVIYMVMIADQTLGGEHATGQHGVQSHIMCIHVTQRFVWKETGVGKEDTPSVSQLDASPFWVGPASAPLLGMNHVNAAIFDVPCEGHTVEVSHDCASILGGLLNMPPS